MSAPSQSPDDLTARLDALIQGYTAEALDAGVDDARVQRAMRFRKHLLDVKAHWIAGDLSPVRGAKKGEA